MLGCIIFSMCTQTQNLEWSDKIFTFAGLWVTTHQLNMLYTVAFRLNQATYTRMFVFYSLISWLRPTSRESRKSISCLSHSPPIKQLVFVWIKQKKDAKLTQVQLPYRLLCLCAKLTNCWLIPVARIKVVSCFLPSTDMLKLNVALC